MAEQESEVSYVMGAPPGQEQPEAAPLRLYEAGNTDFWSPREGAKNVSDARIAHLKTAIEYYRKATAHEKATAYDWLGLGFNLHEASRIPERMMDTGKAHPSDEAAQTAWQRKYEDEALDAYQTSYDFGGERQIESGSGIMEILSKRTDLDKEGQRRLKATRRKVVELKATRQHWVTPIILHLSERRTINELLAPETHVKFDLDGSGRGDTWPWVQPDTAFLVWDEDGRGDVPSGRVLFGSVTWWIFWNNGYEALKSLDNDNDGWLQEDELQGLALWQDTNSNGVSDPGEVVPIEVAGIEGIAVTATGEVDGMPANPQGLRLTGGKQLPTYDWITRPLEKELR
tara:strand:- start:449 stop:1477 length:1029 start_codon:yes stop_codon:yes gene_type:complete